MFLWKFCLHYSVLGVFSNHTWCSEVSNSKISFIWTQICHINTSPYPDVFSNISTEMRWKAFGLEECVHSKAVSISNFLLHPLGNWDNTIKLNLGKRKSLFQISNFCHKATLESMRTELFQKLILGFQFTGTFFFIRENFERETILGLRRHYRGLLTITTAEQLQNKTAICSYTQEQRWIERYFFTTASFLHRGPPPYQLKFMSGHTASSGREGTEQQI